ncbi:MAG: hypothetical protein AB7U83_09790 [Vicinamibacterales bacterium]
MNLSRHELDGIAAGTISCAFRRWRRPTVKSGGSLLTAIGQIAIREVLVIDEEAITGDDARRAGHGSREALLAALARWPDGTLYRIEFGAVGPDPRVALRADDALDEATRHDLRARLRRFDARAGEAWTRKTLEAIRDRPGLRSADLCGLVGQERLAFKANVRKLHALGLTESLPVGYRLSPRGAALLAQWERD